MQKTLRIWLLICNINQHNQRRTVSVNYKSYQFSHALCRRPAKSLINGLRAIDTGQPDYQTFVTDHDDYIKALKSAGAQVQILEALEAFPDSVFIEDAALCLPECAVIMRPGAPSRLGEAEAIIPAISGIYSKVFKIEGPGFIEGGDILTTDKEILVGKSARTDEAGISELAELLKPFGYKVRTVETPADILHFKTDCSLIGHNAILATEKLANSGCFEGYDVITVEKGEEACANAIRFNDIVIMPKGFPATQAKLEGMGYNIIPVGNEQAAKLDGGMSCMSLRFTPS